MQKVFAAVINRTPNTLKINPIEFAVPKRSMFVRISINAFHADTQKFLPVIAI